MEGLKAPNLDSIIKTQRILCCKKLASEDLSSWKIILFHYLKPVGGKFILGYNFEVKKLPIKLPGSYGECLKHFSRCSAANKVGLDNINAVDISKITRWNNKLLDVKVSSTLKHPPTLIGASAFAFNKYPHKPYIF